jgi:hypothetical protein
VNNSATTTKANTDEAAPDGPGTYHPPPTHPSTAHSRALPRTYERHTRGAPTHPPRTRSPAPHPRRPPTAHSPTLPRTYARHTRRAPAHPPRTRSPAPQPRRPPTAPQHIRALNSSAARWSTSPAFAQKPRTHITSAAHLPYGCARIPPPRTYHPRRALASHGTLTFPRRTRRHHRAVSFKPLRPRTRPPALASPAAQSPIPPRLSLLAGTQAPPP